MLDALQQAIGYHFADVSHLELALCHPSLAEGRNNQRLEFLGDRVLGLLVSELLYRQFPDEAEGQLARRHAALVCGQALTHVATEINLGKYLRLGMSEQLVDGEKNPATLEDAIESLIGAMYIDSGLEPVKKFVLTHWQPLLHKMSEPPKDNKSALQEWAQARGLPLPEYKLIDTTGPAHAPEFTIEASVEGHLAQQASNRGKRAAEQAAAGKLLSSLEQSS